MSELVTPPFMNVNYRLRRPNTITGESPFGCYAPDSDFSEFQMRSHIIEHGQPGHWFTGEGGTSSVIDFELIRDAGREEIEKAWIEQYATNHNEFRNSHGLDARKFDIAGKPALGIIAARQVIEIPWRGKRYVPEDHCGHGDRLVREALGLNPKPRGKRPTNLPAIRHVFEAPVEMTRQLRSIISAGREAIRGNEKAEWAEARDFYLENDQPHPAGMSALEHGRVLLVQGDTDEAVRSIGSAGELIYEGLRRALVDDTEERFVDSVKVDQGIYHLAHAINAVGQLAKSRQEDVIKKEILKSAVYALDDFGEPGPAVLEGYKYLERRTRFNLRKRLFYWLEARGAETDMKNYKNYMENRHERFLFGWVIRKNRTHRRP